MIKISGEHFSQNEIQRFSDAVNANSMVKAIGVWAQIPNVDRKPFFSGERAPLSLQQLPKGQREKNILYSRLSRESVRNWKSDPNNLKLKNLAEEVTTNCAGDLYLLPINAQKLRNNGHSVDSFGISTGVTKSYLRLLKKFANSSKNNDLLAGLPKKTGGLTMDMLDQAQKNLRLQQEEINFINYFDEYRRETTSYKMGYLTNLRTAQTVRRFYAEAGIELDDLMSLWGINTTFKDTISYLKKLSNEKPRQDELLSAVAGLLPNEKLVDESQASFSRGKNLELPEQLPSWKKTLKDNFNIIDAAAKTMHFTEITGEILHDKLIFTGKPGARTRGVNVSYLNQENKLINIPLIWAYAPEQQKKQTIFHELTHVLHSSLISKLFGYDAWNNIGSGVRELFALLVSKSATANDSKLEVASDHFRPALVKWFQPIYAYAQLRMLEEMSNANYTLSDQQLVRMEERLTDEIKPLYVLSNKKLRFDLTQFRRMPFDVRKPNDGVVYINAEINSQESSTKNTSNPIHYSSSEELFINKWGKNWIYKTLAFEMFVACLIETYKLSDTNAVNVGIKELFEAEPSVPKEILSRYNIVLDSR